MSYEKIIVTELIFFEKNDYLKIIDFNEISVKVLDLV